MVRRFKSKIQQHKTTAYKILPTDALPKATKEKIDVIVRGIKTGDEAESIAVNDSNDWSYLKTFLPGSVGILCYKGIEVALYYKRQLIKIESDACDPFPQGHIQDHREAWVRNEFLHTKASIERTAWFGDKEKEMLAKISNLEGMSKQQQTENDLLHARVAELEKEVEEQTTLVQRYKDRLLGRQNKGGITQKRKVTK